jgi:CRISPR-associated protein Cmr4
LITVHRALLFLYAETPVHAGADSSLGAIDLPIQREVSTGLPIIKGESLKGALREHFHPDRFVPPNGSPWTKEQWLAVFGGEPPAADNAQDPPKPGALRVHEAQLVAFPVPTLEHTFAWVTSPLVRARLDRKAGLAGVALDPPEPREPANTGDGSEQAGGKAVTEPDDTLCLAGTGQSGTAALGPYLVSVAADTGLTRWGESIAAKALPESAGFFTEKFGRDIYLASDGLLAALSRDCAPVVARVQLGALDQNDNRTKTVAHGPFYSEYLPAETVLVTLLEYEENSKRPEPPPGKLFTRVCQALDGNVVRVGGDESIGKGLMWCRAARDTGTATAGSAAAGTAAVEVAR